MIPVFNTDGNEKLGLNRRDKGPELAGERANGQGLDLNRDYLKLDSPEVRALVALWNEWDPLLFVDMHTTNGSYHREPVTYCTGSNPNNAPAIDEYMWKKLFPAVTAALKGTYGYDSVPYGNFADREHPEKGWESDTVEARYGSNYFALRNRFAILDENYSYADFRTRVLGSYGFVRAILAFTAEHLGEMAALAARADRETTDAFLRQPFAVESKLEPLFDVTIKGYEHVKVPIPPEDKAKYPAWVGDFLIKPTDTPRDYTAPYLARAVPTTTVPLPLGYVVPPANDEVVANLRAHGIRVERLLAPAHMTVERFAVDRVELAKSLYQGRVALTIAGKYASEERELPEGSHLRRPAPAARPADPGAARADVGGRPRRLGVLQPRARPPVERRAGDLPGGARRVAAAGAAAAPLTTLNPATIHRPARLPAGRGRGERMRQTSIVVAIAALLATAVNGVAADATALKSEREKTSYALGVEVGNNLKRQGVDLDASLLAQGLRDALAGGTLLLGEAEVREAVMAFQKELMAKQQEAQKAVSAKAKTEGEAFLAANATKDGVVTLPSGLQYKVITAGSGASPKASDTVSVHYRGRLIDGTEFDSSYKRNEPTSFPVGGVIPGWTEALQLMKQGAKWELYVPAKLAYGDRGAGGLIPPGATLVFEVELLSIK